MNVCSMTSAAGSCGEEAIARFILSAGCVAMPDVREQKLCLHHAMRSTPLGDMELVEDYSVGGAFTRRWKDPYPHTQERTCPE